MFRQVARVIPFESLIQEIFSTMFMAISATKISNPSSDQCKKASEFHSFQRFHVM